MANGFADPSSNHHVAIYRMPNKSVVFDVVTLFEASRRLARHEPIVIRKREDGADLIMSLSPGDALQFPTETSCDSWIVSGVLGLNGHHGTPQTFQSAFFTVFWGS